jgi:hypothetical protein
MASIIYNNRGIAERITTDCCGSSFFQTRTRLTEELHDVTHL